MLRITESCFSLVAYVRNQLKILVAYAFKNSLIALKCIIKIYSLGHNDTG